MTTSDHPFAASAAAANGSQPPSQARLALDNLLRRELKVSDPNDAKAVATALMERYKANPRALAIQSEAKGLPLQAAQASSAIVPAAATSSDSELEQAITDVNRDLEELTTNTILKDITPELQGWASAIRSLIQEGVNAARFALDVTKRDQAFAMRRSLGDYARMARLLGVLTPAMNVNYRKLAQSLDEAASVLVVRMGEALANVGFNGGRFLLQAPYAELQGRRDSVIQNLRSLLSSYQMDRSVNEWNRGLDSYLRLSEVHEKQGQGDLRALLNENELSRCMDNLIQRAAHGNIEGLRALGSTAKLDLQRFRRLLAVGMLINNPLSPPLTSFFQSLQLFVDSFSDTGGFRLLWIARPPLLFYGLYGSGVAGNNAAQRLINIASRRAALADELDCLAGCTQAAKEQVLLDKILYDIDRAIDLYAMGSQELGDAEKRAAAYGFLIATVLASYEQLCTQQNNILTSLVPTLKELLEAFKNELLPVFLWADLPISNGIDGLSQAAVKRHLGLAESILSNMPDDPTPQQEDQKWKDRLSKAIDAVKSDINNSLPRISYYNYILLIGRMGQALEKYPYLLDGIPGGKATWEEALAGLAPLHRELCIQIQYDTQWENLAGSMAPGCIDLSSVSQGLNKALEETRKNSGCMKCLEIRIPMPATNEQNFNTSPF
jgi:hypothetical protein